MTLPRELSYRNGELCQLPVRELEKKLCIHKISEQEIQSGEIILKNRVYCAKLSNLQNETSFKIEFQSGEVILEYKKVEKIISVKRKKIYYIRVRYYKNKSHSKKKVFSKWSKIKRLSVKK